MNQGAKCHHFIEQFTPAAGQKKFRPSSSSLIQRTMHVSSEEVSSLIFFITAQGHVIPP
jgi:hypothetical protein